MKKILIILALVAIAILAVFFFLPPSEVLTPTPSPIPTASSVVTKTPTTMSTPAPVSIGAVAFTSQAPLGGWDDPRQQDGCEEASALMAMLWVQGKTSITPDEALKSILAISDYEEATYGSYHDTNAQDTVKRIFEGYFKFTGAKAQLNITAEDIKAALAQGKLVLVPLNGQKLGNPNFTPPGPDRHMLVIIGYDAKHDEFITNDPGTRKGKGYRYKTSVLESALFNYPTGDHVPAASVTTAMITVTR